MGEGCGRNGRFPLLAKFLVKCDRFWLGRHVEFGLQQVGEGLVLVVNGRPVTQFGVKLHELAVGGFVQGFEVEPAVGVGNGRIPLLGRLVMRSQPLKRQRHIPPQRLALDKGPIVEAGAVWQGKTVQEVGLVMGKSAFDEWHIGRS